MIKTVGWNCTNSMFAMTAPARQAMASVAGWRCRGLTCRGRPCPRRRSPGRRESRDRLDLALARSITYARGRPCSCRAKVHRQDILDRGDVLIAAHRGHDARSISRPVMSPACRMRRWLCPASRPRSSRTPARRSALHFLKLAHPFGRLGDGQAHDLLIADPAPTSRCRAHGPRRCRGRSGRPRYRPGRSWCWTPRLLFSDESHSAQTSQFMR